MSDSKEPARKDDAGKLRYDLIPPECLRELARVYTIGAAKYGDNNWRNGLDPERIKAAVLRHFEAYRSGELNDPVDGQLHLSSVAWGAFALMWYDMQREYSAAADDHEKHLEARRHFEQAPGLARSCGQAYERAASISSKNDEIAKALDRRPGFGS